ncbi:hypothetical protein PFISCL1PPCAC_23430, partial [Pristionchus fissidentatus]
SILSFNMPETSRITAPLSVFSITAVSSITSTTSSSILSDNTSQESGITALPLFSITTVPS